MTKVFNFNNFNLSTSEVVRYADNGTIEIIPANVFLSIIREYEEKLSLLDNKVSELESDVSEQGYDNGYDDGWASAVRDMKDHLKQM